jgi:hypothetical protein
VALATLCRYEGWILPLFLVPAAALVLVRSGLPTRRKVKGLLLALSSGAEPCCGWGTTLSSSATRWSSATPSTTRRHGRR